MWCVVSVLKRSSQRRTVFIKVKSLEMSLTNYKEDHASTSKELSAVLDYLEKLKPQCETKVMTSASGDRIRPEKQTLRAETFGNLVGQEERVRGTPRE